MHDRSSPMRIPLRHLAVLLLPLLLGSLVTFRAVLWTQRTDATQQVTLLAEAAPLAGPPVPAVTDSSASAPVVVERDRPVIAASRDGDRRPMTVGEEAAIADLVPERYRQLVVSTARLHGLDPRLIAAVATVETRFDRTVVGTHGEVGLMQIMADTGSWLAHLAKLSEYDLHDDATSLGLGALYLQVLVKEYGSVEQALAVYNGGPRAAAGWKTNIYVTRVLQYYHGG